MVILAVRNIAKVFISYSIIGESTYKIFRRTPSPTGPNSFIFTHIFTKSAGIGGPRPPPTGNPGYAPAKDLKNLIVKKVLFKKSVTQYFHERYL